MADDLAALLVEMRVETVDVIGQSDGGILALLLAIRHPSKIRALVASGPNLRPDATALFSWIFPLMEDAVKEADAMIAKDDSSRDWARVKRWNELMLNEPHVPTSDLQRIQAPALIIGGDEDAITPEHLLEIYRNIPRAHLFIMPGATHFMLRDQYELYNTMAERFLRRPFERPTTRQVLERR